MRVVVWNCCMAFRGVKSERLAALDADIAVVPECAHADAQAFAAQHNLSFVWADGRPRDDWQHKGLCVFAREGLQLSLSAEHQPDIRVMLPVAVTGSEEFNLLAVWAQPPYAANIQRALTAYGPFLRRKPSLVLGDFNTNAVFDAERPVNHSSLNRSLNELGLVSAYHSFGKEQPGMESQPTHYFLRKRERPFHLDYCYLPEAWLPRLNAVNVGTYDDWCDSSDHVPLTVTLDERRPSWYGFGGLGLQSLRRSASDFGIVGAST